MASTVAAVGIYNIYMIYTGTYFEQPDEQNDRLALHVHLLAAVEPLSDVLHVLAVARFPKHSLCGRPSLPQLHQHLLEKEREQRLDYHRKKKKNERD